MQSTCQVLRLFGTLLSSNQQGAMLRRNGCCYDQLDITNEDLTTF